MYTFQPITHPTSDTKHPLLLLQSIGGERYLFGKIPEGAQRTLTENKIKISKVEHIFLTGKLDWSSIGGLPGMILTIADQGKDKLKLHYTNTILDYIIATWRYFVLRFGIQLSTSIMKDQEVFKDDILKVKAFQVLKPSTESSISEAYLQNDYCPFKRQEAKHLKEIVSKMFPKDIPSDDYDSSNDPTINVELPKDFKIPNITTCYEIQFNNIRGKFKNEEAMKLGVPRGPLFAKLANGEDVTLENGIVVKSEQVLEKSRSFPNVLILDIPDDSFIELFQEKFKYYDASNLGVVYYFIGENVSISEELIKFMEMFGPEVESFVSHENISPNLISFKGAAGATLKLKSYQPDCFNIPNTEKLLSKEFFDCFQKDVPNGCSLIQRSEDDLVSNIPSNKVHVFSVGNDMIVSPKDDPIGKSIALKEQNFNNIPQLNQIFDKEVQSMRYPNISYESMIKNQQLLHNFNSTPEKQKNVEVITLGTGSALPSKYRNVASTLIKVPFFREDGNIDSRIIFFDAGENTFGTLTRMFSSRDLATIMKDTKLIYLSHLHADHHLGIISLLTEWYKHNKDDINSQLYIVAPWLYFNFLKECIPIEEQDIFAKIRFINAEHLLDNSSIRMQYKQLSLETLLNFKSGIIKKLKPEIDILTGKKNVELIEKMCFDLNLKSFQTCRAKHCLWAYSNSVTFNLSHDSNKQFKISFSGDTRPNLETFAKGIGYESDLLIHEATLENELIEDAIQKKHCTINEAITVSNTMKAKKLILTHISQRYPKIPQNKDCIDILANEHCFAFDGMIINYENLGEQEKYVKRLRTIFFENDQDD
ncbi:hypothetical protein TBLA_0A09290 [Henningerozyma blattae CBS 6284]|uniref:ribonuclease Z n=1 Tax=Henningerozyma blattae (strain ATCC 34711 / CBS 6284 / DSM 70876 / NBRC 10599 / NRRL Y-10934 / UCD 77-7) TaxID=1071380 RepID=I2GX64_HENB6|nr:hypothetical protein TBLA_0A09290 [Tetrapisispora blattae CBS 6284]CCH58716.1 hypothetical protein TBLA_0A09290 [Tetrapisispora blattae CBS 6284]